MVLIKKIENHELDFLMDMMYESIHIEENKPSKEVLLNLPHLIKYNEGWGRKGDRALVALNQDNVPIGAVWYRLFDEQTKGYGYVDEKTPELGIAVTKEARGIGIGRLLMSKILQQAHDDGFPALSLSVDPQNETAVQLYKKIGFIPCGTSGTSITMIYSF